MTQLITSGGGPNFRSPRMTLFDSPSAIHGLGYSSMYATVSYYLGKEKSLSFIGPLFGLYHHHEPQQAPDCVVALYCCQDIGHVESMLTRLVLSDNLIISVDSLPNAHGHWAIMMLKSALRRLMSMNHGPHHNSADLPRCLRAITFRAENRNYELPCTMLKMIFASFHPVCSGL